MKIYKYEIPLYYGELKVVITNDFKKALTKLKIKFNPTFKPNSYGAFVVPEDTDIITVFVKPKTTARIISHESVHIVNWVFKKCYINLDLENDEPQAYLTGWVVDKIHESLDKK